MNVVGTTLFFLSFSLSLCVCALLFVCIPVCMYVLVLYLCLCALPMKAFWVSKTFVLYHTLSQRNTSSLLFYSLLFSLCSCVCSSHSHDIKRLRSWSLSLKRGENSKGDEDKLCRRRSDVWASLISSTSFSFYAGGELLFYCDDCDWLVMVMDWVG